MSTPAPTQAKKPAAAAPAAAKPAAPKMDPRMARVYGNRLAMATTASTDPIVEVDGTGAQMKLMTAPRSQHFAISAGTGSGTVSFRGVVIGGVNSRSNATGQGGTMSTYSMLIVVTSDTPRPDDVYDQDKKKVELPASLVYSDQQLRIATSDQVIRDLEDPHALRVIGQGKAPKAEGDKSNQRRDKILHKQITGRSCLGAIFSISVSTQKIDPAGEPQQGDEYEFSGVVYKAEYGADKSGSGGKDNSTNLFENWDAGAAKRMGRWWDENCWARHNELSAIIFGVAPARCASLPVPIREPGFDLKRETEILQRNKKSTLKPAGSAKNDPSLNELYYEGAGGAEEGGADVSGDKAAGAQQPAVTNTGEDMDADEATVSLSDKEKGELARRALTRQSRREYNNAVWITPVTSTNSSALADYMREHGIPHKEWYFVGFNEKNEPQFEVSPDPSARQNFVVQASREDQQTDKDRKPEIVFVDPRPGAVTTEGKPMRLCPVVNIRLQCSQPLPNHALPGEPTDMATGKPKRDHDRQTIDVHTRLGSHSLKAYGIQDPLTMGLIVPQLACVTPGLAICYTTNTLEVLEKMPANPADPALPLYRLSGCVAGVDRMRDGTTPKRDMPALFLDPVIGHINAGVPVTHEAAMKLFKWANKAFEKNANGKVSADGNMTHTTYAKKEFYANTTALAGLPYINCWETRANYADEGAKGEWIAFVESTYIQKPSRYYEEMNALYAALRETKKPMEAARKFFGKLLVDIAEKKAKLGELKSALDKATPEQVIANSEAVKAYAADLAKEAGLREFPFDPLRMSVVFGPLHAVGTEPDYSPDHGLPFHCSMFGIATHYLEKRGLIDYVGDDAFQEVILTKHHAGYAKAVKDMQEGTLESYKAYRAKVEAIRAKEEERSKDLKSRDHPSKNTGKSAKVAGSDPNAAAATGGEDHKPAAGPASGAVAKGAAAKAGAKPGASKPAAPPGGAAKPAAPVPNKGSAKPGAADTKKVAAKPPPKSTHQPEDVTMSEAPPAAPLPTQASADADDDNPFAT